MPQSLKNALVVAKEPMPNVSRKFVTNPIATSAKEGRSCRRRRLAVQIHAAIDAPLTSTSATYRNAFGPGMSDLPTDRSAASQPMTNP